MSQFCPVCGAEFPAQDEKCPVCGEPGPAWEAHMRVKLLEENMGDEAAWTGVPRGTVA